MRKDNPDNIQQEKNCLPFFRVLCYNDAERNGIIYV